MKTKKVTKQMRKARAYKTGLTNVLNEPILQMGKKEVRELSQYFLEDSLTDYEFSINLRMLNY